MKSMKYLLQHIKPGNVYRRSDLDFYSSAIDRHLAQLVKEGSLQKLSQGLYYAPKVSKFGTLPPEDKALVERFLKDDDFVMVSPNSFNALGLGLTQLYNTTWVYNHKRKGEVQLNGKTYEFKIKSSYPAQVSKEFLLVELLNSTDKLAEAPNMNQLTSKLKELDKNQLMVMVKKYGKGQAKQMLKTIFRKELKNA